jgi:hypothetical protein
MATPIRQLPIEVAQGDLETRYVELAGMAIRHARVPAGTDFGPVLKGLPDDRCPAPTGGSCSRARSVSVGTRRPADRGWSGRGPLRVIGSSLHMPR